MAAAWLYLDKSRLGLKLLAIVRQKIILASIYPCRHLNTNRQVIQGQLSIFELEGTHGQTSFNEDPRDS